MTTSRKTPQDRKPTDAAVAEAQQTRFEEVEGHELIKPFKDIKGSDQIRIIGRLKSIGLGDDSDDKDIDFDAFADFVDWIAERYTVDQKKFEDWSAGQAGMMRTLKLAMALLGELGKGMRSEVS